MRSSRPEVGPKGAGTYFSSLPPSESPCEETEPARVVSSQSRLEMREVLPYLYTQRVRHQ